LATKATTRKKSTMVRYLVETGADKNKVGVDCATPLYMAAQEGQLAVVRYLVAQGADLNKARRNGHTPLQVALEEGHNKVVGHLLWAGATPPLFDHADRNVPTNG